jgi:hypothetical protein
VPPIPSRSSALPLLPSLGQLPIVRKRLHHANWSHFKGLLSEQKFQSAESFMVFLQQMEAMGLPSKCFKIAPSTFKVHQSE